MSGAAWLDSVLSHSPWAIAVLIGVPVAGKILITAVALRGSEPKDRPNIIKAVAELFRWGRR